MTSTGNAIDRLGAGAFDGFLWIFEPGHPNQFVDLLWQGRAQVTALSEVGYEADELPATPAVAVGGLLAWGLTDNGDVGYWQLRSRDPSTWTVAINESRGTGWHVSAKSLAAFLADVLSGSEVVSVFPDDFPDAAHRFSPAPQSPAAA